MQSEARIRILNMTQLSAKSNGTRSLLVLGAGYYPVSRNVKLPVSSRVDRATHQSDGINRMISNNKMSPVLHWIKQRDNGPVVSSQMSKIITSKAFRLVDVE